MTCIAGLVDKGKVWIGGDSAATNWWQVSVQLRADGKVFRNGGFLFGACGSIRMKQLLHHSLSPPDHDPRTDIEKYMCTTFIDAVRTCLKNGGCAQKQNEVESGGTFLVGYKGRLFCVEDDYQVGETVNGMAAVGCGRDLALGSLFSTTGRKPRARLLLALEAAEKFSGAVRGPFKIECLG